jgi:hypothetical protein
MEKETIIKPEMDNNLKHTFSSVFINENTNTIAKKRKQAASNVYFNFP